MELESGLDLVFSKKASKSKYESGSRLITVIKWEQAMYFAIDIYQIKGKILLDSLREWVMSK